MTSGIVRRGNRLLRPMGPWSPTMHQYLRRVEVAGFEGSPRGPGVGVWPGLQTWSTSLVAGVLGAGPRFSAAGLWPGFGS